jgi:MFS family permease
VDEPETKQMRRPEAETETETSAGNAAYKNGRMAMLLEPFKYPSVRNMTILSILWSVGTMFGGPFSGAYQVVNLELSFTYIIALSVTSILIRVVLTPLSGKIAAKIGDFPVMIYSAALIAVHYVLWAFTVKDNAHIMLPILFVESAVGFAGIGFTMFSIGTRALPEAIRTTAISVTNTVVGVLGFLSTLVASALVTRMNGASITVGGFVFCDLQIVFFITGVILLLAAGYALYLALAPAEKREA